MNKEFHLGSKKTHYVFTREGDRLRVGFRSGFGAGCLIKAFFLIIALFVIRANANLITSLCEQPVATSLVPYLFTGLIALLSLIFFGGFMLLFHFTHQATMLEFSAQEGVTKNWLLRRLARDKNIALCLTLAPTTQNLQAQTVISAHFVRIDKLRPRKIQLLLPFNSRICTYPSRQEAYEQAQALKRFLQEEALRIPVRVQVSTQIRQLN